MYIGFGVSAYSFAYFGPSIFKGWHYTRIKSQLHTVPVNFVAWVVAMCAAYWSDATRHRYGFLIGCACLCATGLALLLSARGQYVGIYLTYAGAFSALPLTVCYFQTNLAGHKRRAIGSAFQIGVGNMSGIIATFLFLAKQEPRYTTGYIVCLSFIAMSSAAATVYMLGIGRENRLRDEGTAGIVEGDDDGAEVGDRSRDFRYIL